MFLGIPAATLFQLGLKLILGGVETYNTYNDDKKAEFLERYGDLLEGLQSVPEVVDALKNVDEIDTSSLRMKTLAERVAEKEAARDS